MNEPNQYPVEQLAALAERIDKMADDHEAGKAANPSLAYVLMVSQIRATHQEFPELMTNASLMLVEFLRTYAHNIRVNIDCATPLPRGEFKD